MNKMGNKIQKIIRKNGSEIYSTNLPQDVIEFTGWKKGDNLEFQVTESKKVILTKEN